MDCTDLCPLHVSVCVCVCVRVCSDVIVLVGSKGEDVCTVNKKTGARAV